MHDSKDDDPIVVEYVAGKIRVGRKGKDRCADALGDAEDERTVVAVKA